MNISELQKALDYWKDLYGDLNVEVFAHEPGRTAVHTNELDFLSCRVSCVPNKLIIHVKAAK